MKNRLKTLVLGMIMFFACVIDANADNGEICNSQVNQCVECNYQYKGSVKSFMSSDTFKYTVVADGMGGASIIYSNIPTSTDDNYYIIKSNVEAGDFINSTESGLICPNLVFFISNDFPDYYSTEGNGITTVTLRSLKNDETSKNTTTPVYTFDNKKGFINPNSNVNETGKTCQYLKKSGTVMDLIINRSTDGKKTFKTKNVSNARYFPSSTFDEYFKNTPCLEQKIYVKADAYDDDDNGVSSIGYNIYISDKQEKGYEMMLGINPTNDQEKQNEALNKRQAKNRNRIELNDVNCEGLLGKDVQKMLNNIFKTIQYAGPLLVIMFTIIDLIKASISGEQDEIKKVYQKFVKRLIAALLLFFIPLLIKLVFSVTGVMVPEICLG